MKKNIIGRKIPPGDDRFPPALVMKSDIEGFDETIMKQLLKDNVLCHVSYVYGEHISPQFVNATVDKLREKRCTTVIELLDDEFAPTDKMMLPTTSSVNPTVQHAIDYLFLFALSILLLLVYWFRPARVSCAR